MSRRRAQLVVVAAAVVALALVPMTVAYLQVDAATDRRAPPESDPTAGALAGLDAALVDASAAADEYNWSERDAAAAEANGSLWAAARRIETARVADGVVREVGFNGSAAAAWAGDDCPRGPSRRFGDCEAIGGIVVQERAGEAAVVAVAVDVRTVSDRETVRVTAVLAVPSAEREPTPSGG